MSKKRFWIFTACASGLPLGLRLQDEGYNVTMVLIRPEEHNGKWENAKDAKEAKKNKERIDYLNKNGNGLIMKMWTPEALRTIRKGDYVIFDQIYGWSIAEQLRRQGVKVLGGSEAGYKLETERDKTLALVKRFTGLDLPMQKHFGPHSSLKAAEFLEKMDNEKLFVLKSDNTAVITLVAEDNNEEIIQKLKSDTKEIDKDNLVLQEKISGIEYNIETMFCNGVPFLCNIDLEEKRKYNNSSQCQVGCASDLVWTIPLDHELREIILAPMDTLALKAGLSRIDLSVIHVPKDDKIYPLEMCGDRFGYNQIYTLLETLIIPVGEFFIDWMDGKYKKDMSEELFSGDFGASVRVMNDNCAADVPIDYPKEDKDHYWLWDVYKNGGKLLTVGGGAGESPGIITGSGDNPEGAFAHVRNYYRRFHLSTAWLNDYFQDDDDVNSVLYRYHAMKQVNLL